MGKLLDDVEIAGQKYREAEHQLTRARLRLRVSMRAAHDEGISMNKIATAAGMTREGVRYALGQKGGADGQQQ